MLAPSHVIVGLTTGVAISTFSGITMNVWSILAIFLGSLAPDVDGDGSITRPSSIFRAFIPKGVGTLIDGITRSIGLLLRKLTGHRGFFHWPIIGITTAALGYYFNNLWWFWFGWGYFWHIIADYSTMQGVPLLAPFSRNNFSLKIFRTGSIMERAFSLLLLIPLIKMGLPLLPENVQMTLYKFWGLVESLGPEHAH